VWLDQEVVDMKTLIIGGGLSGLALADALEAQGHDYLLVEARDRFGGRIKTEHHEGGSFDMGPAWFWPGQPRIAALIERLGLEKLDQFYEGELTFEDEQGRVQRGRGHASMEGSWRLKGGLGALTGALADKLPENRKQLNAPVIGLAKAQGHISATFADGKTIDAEQVVLALPPRIAAQIGFGPPLPASAMDALRAVPTWMAGQAKAVAVFDTAFWRTAGLSGDAMSRFGPMVEIHDASPALGGPYALFGFIGVPSQNRKDSNALREAVKAQFVRLFGPEAANPSALFIKDWASDHYITTEADQQPLYAHPTYGMARQIVDLWDGRLHFSVTEVAPQFGGFIEGALEASENVLTTFST
jgi:monoamine oxidase